MPPPLAPAIDVTAIVAIAVGGGIALCFVLCIICVCVLMVGTKRGVSIFRSSELSEVDLNLKEAKATEEAAKAVSPSTSREFTAMRRKSEESAPAPAAAPRDPKVNMLLSKLASAELEVSVDAAMAALEESEGHVGRAFNRLGGARTTSTKEDDGEVAAAPEANANGGERRRRRRKSSSSKQHHGEEKEEEGTPRRHRRHRRHHDEKEEEGGSPERRHHKHHHHHHHRHHHKWGNEVAEETSFV